MKNIIVKTAILTVCGLLLLISLLYGIFALFFPKNLGNAFYEMGSYRTAIKFYERQCERTGDFEDLYLLMVRGDYRQDSHKLAKYGKIMVEKKGFSDFCKSKDGQGKISTEEFIEGKYVLAVFWQDGNLFDAVQVAKKCVENDYTQYNPFYMLYSEQGTGVRPQAFLPVVSEIENIMPSLSAKEKEIAKADVKAIQSLQPQD